MADISMKQLLEAGVHFGHQTRKWNPKMADYIHSERDGVHIIDLQKTMDKIDVVRNAVTEIISGGGEILFVGTKEQAKEAVKEEAVRCNMRYVNECWLDGMLNNARLPDILLIIGMNEERIAIQEARNLGIPIIAVADTDCDPDEADYVIPGNDDAVRAIKLIIGTLADTVLEAKKC